MRRRNVDGGRVALGLTMACALAAAGCGDEAGAPGVVTVSVSGEEASRVGFPVGEGADEIAFADGWTIEFTRVIVSITGFELRGRDGDVAPLDVDPVVADVHLGEPELWRFEEVPARRWDDVRYVYGAPGPGSRNVNGADEDIVADMAASGTSMWVEGIAREGADEVDFAYALDLSLVNARCQNGVDETDGVVVPENGLVDAEVTVHLDHLFFDSYATEEPNLRFEPMAAAADADGFVDLAALRAQPLADLRDRGGDPLRDGEGARVVYDPGPLSLSDTTLGDYVRAAAGTTGHFNGEGHCDYLPQ